MVRLPGCIGSFIIAMPIGEKTAGVFVDKLKKRVEELKVGIL